MANHSIAESEDSMREKMIRRVLLVFSNGRISGRQSAVGEGVVREMDLNSDREMAI
jgi:hypothetical protein